MASSAPESVVSRVSAPAEGWLGSSGTAAKTRLHLGTGASTRVWVNGRPVYDITWLPADGTQLGSTKIHVAIVISPIDPGHAADASNPLLVDVYRASPDGTVALDRNVVVAPAGTPIGMSVHGRVSVVGDPARPLNVIAREIAYV